MAVTYPSLRLPAGAEFEINTAGPNSQGGSALIDARTGVPFDNTNSTAYVTIKDASGGTVLAQTAMAWTAASTLTPEARWAYLVPASVLVSGAGNWTATVSIYGVGGLTDTHQRDFYRTLIEAD